MDEEAAVVDLDALFHPFEYTKHQLVGVNRKPSSAPRVTLIDDVIGSHQDEQNLQLRVFHYPLNKKLCRKRHETVLTFNDTQSLVLSKNMLTKAISYCPKKYLIILNPYGGAKLASSYLENVVEPMFFEAGFKFDVVATKYNGHAKDIAKDFDRAKYDGIVTISGDGTLHEIINGISERTDGTGLADIPIGILNGGTANCVVAAILHKRGERCGHKRAIWNATFALIKGKARLVDTMITEGDSENGGVWVGDKTTNRDYTRGLYLCQSISWGLISDVEFESEWLRTLGSHRYTAYALKHILLNKRHRGVIHYQPEPFHSPLISPLFKQYLDTHPTAFKRHQIDSTGAATADEGGWRRLEKRDFSFVALMVNGFWSLANVASPFSALDDRLGFLMLVPQPVSSRTLLTIFLTLDTGNHAYLQEVEWICVRKVKFEFPHTKQLNFDGEQARSRSLLCTIVPHSTKIIF